MIYRIRKLHTRVFGICACGTVCSAVVFSGLILGTVPGGEWVVAVLLAGIPFVIVGCIVHSAAAALLIAGSPRHVTGRALTVGILGAFAFLITHLALELAYTGAPQYEPIEWLIVAVTVLSALVGVCAGLLYADRQRNNAAASPVPQTELYGSHSYRFLVPIGVIVGVLCWATLPWPVTWMEVATIPVPQFPYARFSTLTDPDRVLLRHGEAAEKPEPIGTQELTLDVGEVTVIRAYHICVTTTSISRYYVWRRARICMMTRAGSSHFHHAMLFEYDGLHYLGLYDVSGKLTQIMVVEGGSELSSEAVWDYASRLPEPEIRPAETSSPLDQPVRAKQSSPALEPCSRYPTAGSSGPFRLIASGSIVPPERVEYQAPDIAALGLPWSDVNGFLIVEAIVSDTGHVQDVQILRSAHPEFDRVAVESIRTSRYKPALKNNQPVSVCITFVVRPHE